MHRRHLGSLGRGCAARGIVCIRAAFARCRLAIATPSTPSAATAFTTAFTAAAAFAIDLCLTRDSGIGFGVRRQRGVGRGGWGVDQARGCGFAVGARRAIAAAAGAAFTPFAPFTALSTIAALTARRRIGACLRAILSARFRFHDRCRVAGWPLAAFGARAARRAITSLAAFATFRTVATFRPLAASTATTAAAAGGALAALLALPGFGGGACRGRRRNAC